MSQRERNGAAAYSRPLVDRTEGEQAEQQHDQAAHEPQDLFGNASPIQRHHERDTDEEREQDLDEQAGIGAGQEDVAQPVSRCLSLRTTGGRALVAERRFRDRRHR